MKSYQTVINVPPTVKTYQDFVNTILVPVLNNTHDLIEELRKENAALQDHVAALSIKVALLEQRRH